MLSGLGPGVSAFLTLEARGEYLASLTHRYPVALLLEPICECLPQLFKQ